MYSFINTGEFHDGFEHQFNKRPLLLKLKCGLFVRRSLPVDVIIVIIKMVIQLVFDKLVIFKVFLDTAIAQT